MSPKTKVRAAQVLIPIAFVIAIMGATLANWFVVAAMVLLAISQAVNYRANRDKLD